MTPRDLKNGFTEGRRGVFLLSPSRVEEEKAMGLTHLQATHSAFCHSTCPAFWMALSFYFIQHFILKYCCLNLNITALILFKNKNKRTDNIEIRDFISKFGLICTIWISKEIRILKHNPFKFTSKIWKALFIFNYVATYYLIYHPI